MPPERKPAGPAPGLESSAREVLVESMQQEGKCSGPVVLKVSASPENLEMQILRLHLRSSESEPLEVEPSNLCFNQPYV